MSLCTGTLATLLVTQTSASLKISHCQHNALLAFTLSQSKIKLRDGGEHCAIPLRTKILLHSSDWLAHHEITGLTEAIEMHIIKA